MPDRSAAALVVIHSASGLKKAGNQGDAIDISTGSPYY